jgi:two-component system, chemotaxis family, chemotaxis protein CheY
VTVLIVDDSSVMRKVVERTLRQAGVDITETLGASNGLEALELLRARNAEGVVPGLILSDINMPGMDGFGFVEQMRVEHLADKVPVVMITTEGAEAHVRRALAAGAVAYIRKPFTAEQVRARLQSLIELS